MGAKGGEEGQSNPATGQHGGGGGGGGEEEIDGCQEGRGRVETGVLGVSRGEEGVGGWGLGRSAGGRVFGGGGVFHTVGVPACQ